MSNTKSGQRLLSFHAWQGFGTHRGRNASGLEKITKKIDQKVMTITGVRNKTSLNKDCQEAHASGRVMAAEEHLLPQKLVIEQRQYLIFA